MSSHLFEVKEDMDGFKVLECTKSSTGILYRALADITVPKGSNVVWPHDDHSGTNLRSDRIIMNKIHKLHQLDKCNGLLVRDHKYNEGNEYTEPALDTRADKPYARGIHFAINRRELISDWTSSSESVCE